MVTDATGNSVIEYSLSPALPDGLSFNPRHRTITGVPKELMSAREYTLTALETATDREAELTFTIEVIVPSQPDITVSPDTLSLAAGNQSTYTVTLNQAPESDLLVRPHSHDYSIAGLAGGKKNLMTFTPDNWEQPQTVTVKGHKSGTATIKHRVGSRASDVVVTVTVNAPPSAAIDAAQVTAAEAGETVELQGVGGDAETAAATLRRRRSP